MFIKLQKSKKITKNYLTLIYGNVNKQMTDTVKRRTDKKAEQIETKNIDYHTDKNIVRQKDRETTEQSQKRQTS